MTYYPNFKDFYQRAIIPMGAGRDHFLKEVMERDTYQEMTHWFPAIQEMTHWFVAIEGSLRQSDPEYFHWKVIVFPSREDGSYQHSIDPYYESKQFDTINESFEYSRVVINQLSEGQINLTQISS